MDNFLDDTYIMFFLHIALEKFWELSINKMTVTRQEVFLLKQRPAVTRFCLATTSTKSAPSHELYKCWRIEWKRNI